MLTTAESLFPFRDTRPFSKNSCKLGETEAPTVPPPGNSISRLTETRRALLSINRRNHRVILTSADVIWNGRDSSFKEE